MVGSTAELGDRHLTWLVLGWTTKRLLLLLLSLPVGNGHVLKHLVVYVLRAGWVRSMLVLLLLGYRTENTTGPRPQ